MVIVLKITIVHDLRYVIYMYDLMFSLFLFETHIAHV